ncbi:hypothetical protein [Xanthomonas sp. NCPPB 2632]|uniref:hypothetical protein n=1 Tax=Xanthomonas sp. NCPPB 2632 TaxID=3240912 RepID=UPI0035165FC0
MIENELTSLADAVALREPLVIRNVAFDTATFDALKHIQRGLEHRIRRDTSNAEVLKYLLLTHPDARATRGECL